MANKNRNSASGGENQPSKRKTATTTSGGALDKGRIILPVAGDVCPLALNTHEILLNTRIVPPPGPGDRTKGDKDRFRDRNKGKLDKNKLKDILQNNPVFGDKGKVKVPIDGGKEPRWRLGRDGKGGKGGRKGGKDPGDLVYVDMDYEDFVQWMFDDLDLPFLQKTDEATNLIKTYKMRGKTDTGPESRIDWEETEVRRIERSVGMLNAHPEDFPVLNDFFRLAIYKTIDNLRPMLPASFTEAELDLAKATLVALHEQREKALPLSRESMKCLNKLVGMLADYQATLRLEPEAAARLNRMVGELRASGNVEPRLRGGIDIPSKMDAPFQDDDFIYQRVEARFDPDSKAVAFLVLDRSGSMGGDPLAIAKFYFLLNILFLRSRFKDVAIVMVAHDAQAYEIQEESKFYQIEVNGGTLFEPAYEMVLHIANERFPLKSWNRYMFHATDGYMFEGEDMMIDWFTRLVSSGTDCGSFRFLGYLEIDPYAGRGWGSGDWAPGGQALKQLDAAIKKHVGMARVSNMDQVVDAFKAILTQEAEA
jgi:uncharacterized sporulation protein YeaH/YhbH (DUF444 family)